MRFDFLYNFGLRISHSKKNSARNEILMKFAGSGQIFQKFSNINCHRNLSRRSRVIPSEWTDRQTARHDETNGLIFNFVKASTNTHFAKSLIRRSWWYLRVGTVGTVRTLGNIGTVRTVGTVGNIGTIRTVRTLGNIGTVRTVGNIGTVRTVRTVGNIGTVRTAGTVRIVGNIGTVWTVRTVGTVQT